MPTDHTKTRKPYTFSATSREIDRLDAWAHHHNLNRSEAVRAFIAALRIDGQTALEDFEEVEPHPGAVQAVEDVEEAQERRSRAQNDDQPKGVVAKATVEPKCYEKPSMFLGGRCLGGKPEYEHNARKIVQRKTGPACPVCWPSGMTAEDTFKEHAHQAARHRAEEAERRLKEALEVAWEARREA